MYCKIIRSKQAGKMSDVLFFISWASLVPVAVQAAALSVERVEVEINPICVFFPHGFTRLKDMMDDCICCRKESELYTLLWVFGFPLYLYPSLRDEVVCADKETLLQLSLRQNWWLDRENESPQWGYFGGNLMFLAWLWLYGSPDCRQCCCSYKGFV